MCMIVPPRPKRKGPLFDLDTLNVSGKFQIIFARYTTICEAEVQNEKAFKMGWIASTYVYLT